MSRILRGHTWVDGFHQSRYPCHMRGGHRSALIKVEGGLSGTLGNRPPGAENSVCVAIPDFCLNWCLPGQPHPPLNRNWVGALLPL